MPQEPLRNGGRLDSWKEIASYLNQGVRTVQRWELDEGLPVHRPEGKKRGTVYAFQDEIDAWFRGRGEDQSLRKKSRHRALPTAVWWAAAVVIIAAATTILIQIRDDQIAGASSSEQVVDSFPPSWGAFSPEGRRIAYQDSEDGGLYLRDLDNKASRRLVEDPVDARILWSPDGGEIAYACVRNGKHHLEVLDLNSHTRRVLRTGTSFDATRVPIGWDTAANRLLCSTTDMDSFGFLSLRDQSVSALRSPAGPLSDAALSPDGRLLAYARRSGRFWDLELLRTDGQADPMRVALFEESERYPFWSRDSRTLLFARIYGISTSDKTEVWAVSIDPETATVSGEPYLVGPMPDLLREIRPVLTTSRDLLWGRRKPGHRAYVLEVKPGTGEPVGARSDFLPGTSAKHWAPNEAARLYYWDNSVRWQVLSDVLAFRERDMETGRERIHQIPWPDLPWAAFYYSNDHTKAVFKVPEPADDRYSLYLYSVAGGKLSKLVTSDKLVLGLLSHDTQRVAFVEGRGESGERTLGLVDIATKSTRTLYRGGLLSLPDWSPDDTELAFADGRCLMVLSVGSAKASRVSCAPEIPDDASASLRALRNLVNRPAWGPESRMLVWATLNFSERRVEMWAVDRATGSHSVVWTGERNYRTYARDADWSPDGRFISFTLGAETQVEIRKLRHPQLSANTARASLSPLGLPR